MSHTHTRKIFIRINNLKYVVGVRVLLQQGQYLNAAYYSIV